MADDVSKKIPCMVGYSAVQHLIQTLAAETESVDINMLWSYMAIDSAGNSDDPAVLPEWNVYWGADKEKTISDAFVVATEYLAYQLGWSVDVSAQKLLREMRNRSDAGRSPVWKNWTAAVSSALSNPTVQAAPPSVRVSYN